MRAIAALSANLLLVSVTMAGVGLPFGLPPGAEDPVMSKIAPDKCLLYATWAGAASPDPASKNHTEQLVAEEEVQTFITELEKRLTTGILQIAAREGGDQGAQMATLAIEWGKRLLTRPAALFVAKLDITPEKVDVEAGAVVNVGEDAAQLKALLGKMLGDQVGQGIEVVEIDGTKYFRGRPTGKGPQITFGVSGAYFLVGVGEGSLENILKRGKTNAPQWLTDERAKISIPRMSTFAYFDVKTVLEKLATVAPVVLDGAERDFIGQLQPLAKAVGIDKISHITCASGLDDTAYVRRCLVALDGELTGLLSMANAKPLAPEDLASIPSDSTIAIAARMDAGQLMDHLMAAIGKIEPRSVEQANRSYDEIKEQMGFHIRDDLVASLGDVWTIYHSPGEGGLLTGTAGVVKVKDHDKLAEIHDKLLTMLKAQELQARRAGVRRVPKLGQLRFAGQDIQYWSIPDAIPLMPAWCLTEDELIVALFPQTIKAYLSRGDDYQSLATVPQVAKLFEGGKAPIKIYYQDTPTLFEYAYPVVQILSRIIAGDLQRDGVDINVSLLPLGSTIAKHVTPDVVAVVRTEAGIEITAYESVPGSTSVIATVPLTLGWFVLGSRASAPFEEAVDGIGLILNPDKALEANAKNRLKQIGLAMHNYHDTFGKFPAAVPKDGDGKPLLSWRVHILPFIEQANLYDQFRLDEPWDSEHNKVLIEKMPAFFTAPGSKAGAGKTVYLTVRHDGAMFPADKQLRFADITDGSSNTIMAVEASDKEAVIWTKSDDYNLDPENPMRGLVQLRKGGFLVVMGDGSVQKVSDKIDPKMLNALFTRNGGEVVELPRDRRRGDGPVAVPRLERVIPIDEARDLPPLDLSPPPRKAPLAPDKAAPDAKSTPRELKSVLPDSERAPSKPPKLELPKLK